MIYRLRQPTRNPHHGLLQQVLDDLLNEPSAWPFLKPVDAALVHDYYNVITHPIGELNCTRLWREQG